MRWPLTLCALALLCVAGPAGSTNPYSQKESVDAKLSRVQARITALQSREGSLRAEIAGYTADIRGLERQIGTVQAQLDPLQRDLDLHQRRLARLNELYRLQTARLALLRSQYEIAFERLNRRLVDLYVNGEPGTLEVLLSSRSFADLLDQLEFLRLLAHQDEGIANEVRAARDEARIARTLTSASRVRVRATTRVVAARAAQVRDVRIELAADRSRVDESRGARKERLARLDAERRGWVSEADSLRQASADLAAKIRSAETEAPAASTGTGTPSAAGLIWPVNAPITSPFGMRWGRLHAGLDLGAWEGTPIHAAAAGRVIYTGWLGGYGNLVVIDHGGGLSTAYAHQSRIAVSTGQSMAQGETIGYVGNTGHSLGPHLHFEVRINGSAVDPLGYL